MAKFKEHLIRWFENIPKRIWACMLAYAIFAGTIAMLYTSLNTVFVTDSRGREKTIVTYKDDPQELMTISGIVAKQYDEYFLTQYDNNVVNLNIERAFPVNVKADGTPITSYMTSGTVSDALEKANVVLGEHDYTEPSLNKNVQSGETIIVHRVVYNDTVTQEEIPFSIDYKYSSLLHRYKRRTYTLNDGSNGLNELTFRQRVVDGQIESEQLMKTEQVVPVENSVILAYGNESVSDIKTMDGVEIVNNVPSSYSRVITGARCAGYSSKRGRGASRMGLYYGTVAVNPNVIPYGSKLYITSADGSFVYGYAIASDTGTALMEGIIDIDLYYETYLESYLNGIKYLNVYVLN
ncbi:MAG: ubiquitin-like domain-containing protein [Oscillospiraceae bacterium]